MSSALHLWMVIGIGVGIVLVAALFRLSPHAPRGRLRQSVILYVCYGLTLAGAAITSWTGASGASSALFWVSDLLQVFVLINMGALLLFDGLFYLLKYDYPDIWHDLAVGAGYFVTIGWLMHRSGVNASSLMATSAVLTIVLGVSLQATLGAIIGGLAVQFDESFKEGDWVELESKVQGQIKKIRWRHTTIETRDWDTLIVPNGALLSQTIKVLGRREGAPVQHRMWVYFNVDFRHPPGEVIRAVTEALHAAPIPNVANDPKPNCICFDFARDNRDSFTYYAVRYYLTNLSVDDPTSSAVRERIFAGLKRSRIPLAMPAHTVFVSHDDPDHAQRKSERDLALRRDALRAAELFSRLSDEENARLAAAARRVPFARGEIIARQGAAGHGLYVLTKGHAEIRVSNSSGVEMKVAEIFAPTFFGEMALMTGAPREATVVALSDIECLRVDKTDFQDIITTRPELAQEISTVLAQRRVELVAVRENLDAEAKRRHMMSERGKILASIRDFFGLSQGHVSIPP
jgi:small-conductance mechanosensitive channel/CRP-like cAMP-binding protein